MKELKNSLFSSIHHFIKKHNLIIEGQTIILGLSGGPDSIFLLHLLAPLHQSGFITLIAGHLNHEWRPNAAKDIEFCRDISNKLGIRLIDGKISDLQLTIKNNGSQEEIGRKARRAFLEKVSFDHKADAIALGHHYDDQQETFFIRLLRGASLTGLTAMHPRNGLYIRPLLQTKKEVLVNYLDQNGISYLIDPTNSSTDYLRNRVRHQAIPALRACDNRFDITFEHTLLHLHETENYLNAQTLLLFNEICFDGSDTTDKIQVKKLCNLDSFMQKRLIMHWLCANHVPFNPSNSFFQEILRFLKRADGGTHIMHPSWSLTKKQGVASIKKI